MPYNFATDIVQTKKLCSWLSSSEVRFERRSADLRFWAPSDHLRLIGKRIVDFLLVLIELFSLGVTAEVLWVNIGSKSAISLQLGPV